MKKLLLILTIWLSTSASAQKIHFTDTTNVWKQLIVPFNDFLPPPYNYYSYHYLRDSVIDSIQYRVFNFTNDIIVGVFGSGYSLVREDTDFGKVYIRDLVNDSDIVVMDYNLNVGDTFSPVFFPEDTDLLHDGYQRYVVDSLDSVLINSFWHKVWRFNKIFSGTYYVIEGIGCVAHPIRLVQTLTVESPGETMYCFSNRGITPSLSRKVSHFDNLGSCTYYPKLATSELTLSNTITVFPNPSTTHITLTTPSKITTLTITNLLGQTIYTHDYNSEKVEVDVSNLPSGIYLVRINGSDVQKFIKE